MFLLFQPTGTNVPSGDLQKEMGRETTMQYSFPNKTDIENYKPYLKSEVSSKLGRTNFKQADGHSKYNDYQSTATVSYQPCTSICKWLCSGWQELSPIVSELLPIVRDTRNTSII